LLRPFEEAVAAASDREKWGSETTGSYSERKLLVIGARKYGVPPDKHPAMVELRKVLDLARPKCKETP
jgi:hypothetical protein